MNKVEVVPIDLEEEALINAQAIEDDTVFTDAELAQFRPAHEVLPLELQQILGMKHRGRPVGSVAKSTKQATSLRLDPQALSRWRASGKGWQTRAARVLEMNAP